MISLLLTAAALSTVQNPADEATYYAVDHLTPPTGERLEVGGLGFLPDGTLVVSTRRGEVWFVDDALAEDPGAARFRLFADGLHEGLGLAVRGNDVFVLQRGELSRLADTDGDGSCDEIATVSAAWGLSGNYHEFAFGLPVDARGDFWIALNVGFQDATWWLGESLAPWRGWVARIGADGSFTPFACGFRSPCGLGLGVNGELFVTDNQGDWLPASPILHVREGGFYGHPASLDWTAEYRESGVRASLTNPPPRAARDRANAALWLPYKWSRSPGNLVADLTGGRFGPFAGQMFVAELTNGLVLRADFEEVQSELQGWCTLFRQEIGSVCRVAFAPDGTLFCGLTNRGWGGLGPADGIARVRWRGVTPFEIAHVHLLQDGFELTLTEPLAGEIAPETVELVQYDYDYWWEYGSPERDIVRLPVSAVQLDESGTLLTLRVADGLRAGRMARVSFPESVRSRSGSPLLHREFAYCVNQLPQGPRTREHVAKIVPPPPPKDTDEAGWLRLCWGDTFALWEREGWDVRDVALDPDDTSRLRFSGGNFALVNLAGNAAAPFRSRPEFADGTAHLRWFFPRGGRAALRLMDRYEILLGTASPDAPLDLEAPGAVLPGPGFAGQAPRAHGAYPEGNWQTLDVEFRAPRFDDAGRKIADARIVEAVLNGVTVLDGVDVPAPSAGGPLDEVARGPFVLRVIDGTLAFGDIRFRPRFGRDDAARQGDWRQLLADEEALSAWQADGEGEWSFEYGEVVGRGGAGHLFSPQGDYREFDLHAEARISDQGNSGLYFRARPGGEGTIWPSGYEVQINSSYPDPQKTGSLYGLVPITTHLIAPGTWFTVDVSCRELPAGTHILVRLQGVTVVDWIDPERRHGAGHIALQQHHEGSEVAFRNVWLRTLP